MSLSTWRNLSAWLEGYDSLRSNLNQTIAMMPVCLDYDPKCSSRLAIIWTHSFTKKKTINERRLFRASSVMESGGPRRFLLNYLSMLGLLLTLGSGFGFSFGDKPPRGSAIDLRSTPVTKSVSLRQQYIFGEGSKPYIGNSIECTRSSLTGRKRCTYWKKNIS